MPRKFKSHRSSNHRPFVEPNGFDLAAYQRGILRILDWKYRDAWKELLRHVPLPDSNSDEPSEAVNHVMMAILRLHYLDKEGKLGGIAHGWFNSQLQLVYSRDWLSEKVEEFEFRHYSPRHLTRCLRGLANAKLVHLAHGGSDGYGRGYLRFNIGTTIDLLEYYRKQLKAQKTGKSGSSKKTAQTAETGRAFYTMKQNRPLDREDPPKVYQPSRLLKGELTREEAILLHKQLEAACGGGVEEQQTPNPENEEFGPTAKEVFERLETRPILNDPVTGEPSQVKLSLEDKRALARLVHTKRLNLQWLHRYEGAIIGTADNGVEEQREETWWLKASLAVFLARFPEIRRELNAAQARVLQQSLPGMPRVTDLQQGWSLAKDGYTVFVREAVTLPEYAVHSLMENRGNNLNPVWATWYAQEHRAELERMMPGLAADVVNRHQARARFLLVTQYSRLLFSLEHGGLPVTQWFGLTPQDWALAKRKWALEQANYLAQQHVYQSLCS